MGIGARLKQLREDRGLTVADLADRTRVAPRILHAIERDDFRAVPGGIFARGYLRAYAHEVGADADEIVARYAADQEPGDDAPPASSDAAHVTAASQSDAARRSRTVQYAVIGVLAGGVLVAYYLLPTLRDSRMAMTSEPGQVGQQARHAAPPSPQGESPNGDAARAAATAATGAPVAPAKHAGPGPASTRLHVRLRATEDVWVAASADDRRVVYRTLRANEQVELTADTLIKVRAGNAGALQVAVNDREFVAAGPSGTVRDLTFPRSASGSGGQ